MFGLFAFSELGGEVKLGFTGCFIDGGLEMKFGRLGEVGSFLATFGIEAEGLRGGD
tara:strand:- start:20 stop:187 length:168 start_codon:yes stop_codon:yes gene_type:complete